MYSGRRAWRLKRAARGAAAPQRPPSRPREQVVLTDGSHPLSPHARAQLTHRVEAIQTPALARVPAPPSLQNDAETFCWPRAASLLHRRPDDAPARSARRRGRPVLRPDVRLCRAQSPRPLRAPLLSPLPEYPPPAATRSRSLPLSF